LDGRGDGVNTKNARSNMAETSRALSMSLAFGILGCAHAATPQPPTAEPRAAVASAAERTRGQIVAVEGRFAYDYYDVSEPDSHAEFLQAKGFQGGGATWAGIVFGLLKLRQPELLAEIQLDDEAEGLRVWSASRTALETIASLVTEAKANETLLLQAIEAAQQQGQIE
jgi:hypothetical protein